MNTKQKIAAIAILAVFLALTIQGASAATYSFYGPVVANPSVGNGGYAALAYTNVSVTIMQTDGYLNRTVWGNSTGSTFSQTITGNYKSIMWNYSTAQNYTSLIEFFSNETTSNYFIFVADPDVPQQLYTINIVDFVGMTNPYLEVDTTYNGAPGTYQNVVARHNLNVSNTIPFALNQYYTYQLKVICDQGTYTQDLTTGNEYTINIPILADMFPSTNQSTPALIASRINATTVGISYSDSSAATNWLTTVITHESGTTTITDYSTNTTGDSQTILWTDADSDKSYSVAATANVAGTNYTWTIPISLVADANPFTGVFDFLGTNTPTIPFYYTGWPGGMTSSQVAQLIAAFFITCFLGVGSFRNAGASMIAACCFGGIMFAMGWWNGGLTISAASAIPEFGLAFFIAIITHFNEKKTEGQGLN